MNNSSLSMNQQEINNAITNVIQHTLADPQLGQIAYQIDSLLKNQGYNTVQQILEYTFQFGGNMYNSQTMISIVSSVIRGMVAYECTNCNLNIIGYHEDLAYYSSIMQQIQQPAANPSYAGNQYNQPNNNPGYLMQSQPQMHGGGQITSSMRTNAEPQQRIWENSSPLTAKRKENNIMKENDHILGAASDRYKIESSQISTVTETEAKEEELKEIPEAIRLPLIDKLDTKYCFGSVGCSESLAFLTIKESKSKSVLLKIVKNYTLPTYSRDDEINTMLINLSKSLTVSEFYEILLTHSKELSITGIINWLDTRITKIVINTLRYRYNQTKLNIGSFMENKNDVIPWLDEKGWLEDVESIILDNIKTILTTVTTNDCTITSENKGADTTTYLEVSSQSDLLTIPWNTRYNDITEKIWFDGVNNNVVDELLDRVFIILPDTAISVGLVDSSGNIYNVFRKGKPILSPGKYIYKLK